MIGFGPGLGLLNRRRQRNYVASWLLRDNFATDRAAGAVNGTAAEPGPGTRTVTDVDNRLSISSAKAQIAAGSTQDAYLYVSGISRQPGVAMMCDWSLSSPQMHIGFSLSSDLNFASQAFRLVQSGQGIGYYDTSYQVVATSAGSGKVFIILRAAGSFAFLQDANTGNLPVLVWIGGVSTSTNQKSGLRAQGATGVGSIDNMRLAQLNWLPTPLTSDGFGGTFGTSDGLGHAETSGLGAGGGGKTWTQQVGTWANSAGKAAATALSGGVAVATTPQSTADVLATLAFTRSAGAGGVVVRWTDSNNYLYAEHDGTNCYLKQVLAGATSTLVTAAATYSAGAEIRLIVESTSARLYYNNALVGTSSGINAALTGAAAGLRTTDTGNTIDDFTVYARGTSGEYNAPLNEVANG